MEQVKWKASYATVLCMSSVWIWSVFLSVVTICLYVAVKVDYHTIRCLSDEFRVKFVLYYSPHLSVCVVCLSPMQEVVVWVLPNFSGF